MTLDVEVLPGSAASRIARQWNELVKDDATNLTGYDALSTYDWFDASAHAFPEGALAKIVAVRRDGQLAGILPVVPQLGDISHKHLMLAPELYGGRNGPVMDRDDPELLAAMLDALKDSMPDWSTVQMTLLSGGRHERILQDVCQRFGYRALTIGLHESPFFKLPATPEAMQKQLAKDIRQRVKTTQKRLGELGSAEFTRVRAESQISRFMDDLLLIERGSWKQEAGTSITSNLRQQKFYEEFLPRAAAAAILDAMVLRIDGKPVCYVLGLSRHGVFSCLKSSMVQMTNELAPVHAVRFRHICELIAQGVETYDFMGKLEPHKFRWSSATHTYKRATWVVYNKKATSRLAFRFKQGRDWLRQNIATKSEPS